MRLPHSARDISGRDKDLLMFWKSGVSRRSPNPPSLSKIPAKAIDPATGASTWAFGSHR